MNKKNKATVNSIGKIFMQNISKMKLIIYIIFSLCCFYLTLIQGFTLAQEFTLVQVNDVCTNLKATIRNKLDSPRNINWQMTLTDENSNILGYGSSNSEVIEIDVYDNSSREFYIFFFTDNGPIHFSDGSTGFRANHFVSNYERKIVITHRLEGNTLLHLNDCNISLKNLFASYRVSIR